jgi:hypothetical protein
MYQSGHQLARRVHRISEAGSELITCRDVLYIYPSCRSHQKFKQQKASRALHSFERTSTTAVQMEAQNMEVAALVQKITGLHAAISKLPSLSPGPEVDALFTDLVMACVPRRAPPT